jgi:hypothetical protein
MRVPFEGFIGPAYAAASWKASTQRAVNQYPEGDPEKGLVYYPAPGHTTIGSRGSSPVLAMEPTPSGLVIVTADSVHLVPDIQNGAFVNPVQVGATGSAYAIVAQAGDRVMMVNGNQGFWFDRTAAVPTLNTISDAAFPENPQSCTALDGYFIAHGPNSDQFYWSSPFDPSTWNALDFASAENLNDKLQRAITVERELYLIGSQSTEIWATTGGEDTFDRIQGTYIPYGTAAPLSAAVIGQALLWLAQDTNGGSVVMQARGLQSKRVSTHAIEQEIAGYVTTNDAYALTYQQHGHLFYVLSFPTAGKTWVYDLATQLWHERSSLVPDPSQPDQVAPISYVESSWRARCHAYFAGINLIGDSRGPNIAQLSTNIYSENGVDMICKRVSPHVSNKAEYLTISGAEFIFQPGVGLATGNPEDVDPHAMLRVSKDGGRQWSAQRTAPIGALGEYLESIHFKRLGRARDFVIELSMSAQVYRPISGAYLDLTP